MKWYRQPDTWDNLVLHDEASREALAASLGKALWQKGLLLCRGTSPEAREEDTRTLASSTRAYFIQNLPAPMASAVTGSRLLPTNTTR